MPAPIPPFTQPGAPDNPYNNLTDDNLRHRLVRDELKEPVYALMLITLIVAGGLMVTSWSRYGYPLLSAFAVILVLVITIFANSYRAIKRMDRYGLEHKCWQHDVINARKATITL